MSKKHFLIAPSLRKTAKAILFSNLWNGLLSRFSNEEISAMSQEEMNALRTKCIETCNDIYNEL